MQVAARLVLQRIRKHRTLCRRQRRRRRKGRRQGYYVYIYVYIYIYIHVFEGFINITNVVMSSYVSRMCLVTRAYTEDRPHPSLSRHPLDGGNRLLVRALFR